MRTSRWLSSKESACQCRRCKRRRFDPWVRKVPWRRKWQPTLVFSPWKSHGQRSLWDRVQGVARSWTQQSNYAQQHTHTHTHTHTQFSQHCLLKRLLYFHWVFKDDIGYIYVSFFLGYLFSSIMVCACFYCHNQTFFFLFMCIIMNNKLSVKFQSFIFILFI